MKKFLIAAAVLAAFPLAAAADITKEDIKKLIGAGISDEVIVTFIRSHGPVSKLSPDDLIELKQAGASEKVLGAVAGGASAPAQKVVVQRNVAVPQTTVVYDTPTYTYLPSAAWCSSHYLYDSCYGVRPYTFSSYYYPRYSYSYWPSTSFYFSRGHSHSHGSRHGWSIRGCW